MKVIVVHNFYQQPGGEDMVFADETALLEQLGHHVVRHVAHNDAVAKLNPLTLAGRTIWNPVAAAELHALVVRERADIVHFHNTFPLLSPAVYSAAGRGGAAVVQTLHNYRLTCPAGILYRDGHVCEECLGKTIAWPSVVHACYRGSRPATAAVAAMLGFNGLRGTYRHDVDAYVALTEFARQKMTDAGLPAERVYVKQNFVWPDPGVGDGGGGYVLFVGRVTESKGIDTLLAAWARLDAPVRLKVLGDGDRMDAVRAAAAGDPRIEVLGRRPLEAVYEAMGRAAALVFPSVWYEGLPKTILESFAKGTPVIASRLGSMSELVSDNRTGACFAPGDPTDLARVVGELFAQPAALYAMRMSTREEFDARYTSAINARLFNDLYAAALRRRHGTATATATATVARQASAPSSS